MCAPDQGGLQVKHKFSSQHRLGCSGGDGASGERRRGHGQARARLPRHRPHLGNGGQGVGVGRGGTEGLKQGRMHGGEVWGCSRGRSALQAKPPRGGSTAGGAGDGWNAGQSASVGSCLPTARRCACSLLMQPGPCAIAPSALTARSPRHPRATAGREAARRLPQAVPDRAPAKPAAEAAAMALRLAGCDAAARCRRGCRLLHAQLVAHACHPALRPLQEPLAGPHRPGSGAQGAMGR